MKKFLLALYFFGLLSQAAAGTASAGTAAPANPEPKHADLPASISEGCR